MSFEDISIYVSGSLLLEKTSFKILESIKFYSKDQDNIGRILPLEGSKMYNMSYYYHTVKSIYVDDSYLLHNELGPSLIYDDGSFCWYKRGYKHRENGPAFLSVRAPVIFPFHLEHWYKDGLLHREDGPAVRVPGNNFVSGTGDKDHYYWLNGKELDKGEFRSHLLEKYYGI